MALADAASALLHQDSTMERLEHTARLLFTNSNITINNYTLILAAIIAAWSLVGLALFVVWFVGFGNSRRGYLASHLGYASPSHGYPAPNHGAKEGVDYLDHEEQLVAIQRQVDLLLEKTGSLRNTLYHMVEEEEDYDERGGYMDTEGNVFSFE